MDFKECPQCGGFSYWRDGQCLNCLPIDTIHLNGLSPAPAVMARIATHLEKYGKVTVVGSALCEEPGASAFLLGEAFAKAEMEREKNGL